MLAPRPVRLLDPPEPIQAMALLPDNPPVMIRWRHHSWKVRRATGPERISPSWWQIDRQKTRSRDYYRIETNEGARLWIYREGLPERGEESAWYLHGFFA
jgi:protein ImuB